MQRTTQRRSTSNSLTSLLSDLLGLNPIFQWQYRPSKFESEICMPLYEINQEIECYAFARDHREFSFS